MLIFRNTRNTEKGITQVDAIFLADGDNADLLQIINENEALRLDPARL